MDKGKMIVLGFVGAVVVACGSGGSSSSGGGGATIDCTFDGQDSDCTRQNLPRKFDCKSADAQQNALAVGCAKENPNTPTDYDVCCPDTVNGSSSSSSSSSSSGGATSVTGCEQKAGADTDAECAGVAGKPRKLDCDATATNNAVNAGCAKITPTGSDVCCPTTVTGAGK